MSDLHPALQLLGTIAGLWILATLLARHLQALVLLLTRSGAVASGAYDLLVLPGVIVHEAAHLLVAFLLRVRIVRADLFRFRRPSDLRQGEVVVQRVDPLRMSLIGAAPLLVGMLLVLLLLRLVQLPPLEHTPSALWTLFPVFKEPLSLLGLYTVWAIANAMFPSSADRVAWRAVGGAIALLIVLAAITGLWPAVPARLLSVTLDMMLHLTRGLLRILMLDLALLVVVVGLEWLVGQLSGRRAIHR
jgi:hypothetical protein